MATGQTGRPASRSSIPPMEDLRSLPRRKRIRPNGRHYFTARTVIFPVVFILIHYLIGRLVGLGFQLAAGKLEPGMILSTLLNGSGETDIMHKLIAACIQILVYLVFIVYQQRKSRHYIGLKPLHYHQLPSLILMPFGMYYLSFLLLISYQYLATIFPALQKIMEGYMSGMSGVLGHDGLAFILTVALLGPIAEELLHRGIVVGELRRVLPDGAVIIISALVFSIFHLNFFQMVYVLPAGLVLGCVRVWTNSIWSSIILHVLYNLFGGFGVTYIVQLSQRYSIIDVIYHPFMIAMTIILLVLLILMGKRYRKDKRAGLVK